jgi:LPS-assembly lipoprotein
MNKNNNPMRTLISLLVVCLAALTLAGCGFHLRGVVKLPADMERIYIAGNENSSLVRELGLNLRASGVQVVPSAKEATAVLHVSDVAAERRVLSVTAAARVREYELVSSVHFSVTAADGKTLRPDERVLVARDFQYDENDILGTSNQEALIRKEMQRDLVQIILRRLQHTTPQ